MKSILRLYYESFSGLSKPIWFLSLVTLINRSGAMVLPFLSVYLTQQLGFTKGQTGLIITAFGVGSMVGTYTGGYLTDKIGYYKIQFWSLFLGGLMFIFLAYITSFWFLLLFIFLLSMVAESYRPAAMVAVDTYSEKENKTRSFGLLRFAINLGFSVGPALGGLIAASAGYFWLFWVDGLSCMIAAILFRFTLKEKQAIEREVVPELSEKAPKSVFRDYRFLFFLLTCTLSTIVFVQMGSVLPVYFKEIMFLNEAYIGLILAMNGVIITLFEMPLVYKLEKKSLLKIIGIGYLFMGLCYVGFLIAPTLLIIAIIGIILLTIGEMLAFPFSNTYAVGQSNPATKGRYMAVYAVSFSVAHIIAPTLGFQVAENLGYSILWIIMILLAGLSIIGIWILIRFWKS